MIYKEESVDEKQKSLQKALLDYKKCADALDELLKYEEWDRKLEGIKGFELL